jgi:AAA domain
VAACALPAPVGLAGACVARGAAPADVVTGYLEVQLDAAVALVKAWQAGAGPGAFDWPGYGLAVGPYALCGGVLLGSVAGALLCGGCFERTARNDLRVVDADDYRRHRGQPEPQPVDGFAARGRLTALTALPKQGKTYAWFGLLKARQTGGRWFGRVVLRGKTFVLSEEDRGTFTAKVLGFGIRSGALAAVHAPETPDARFGQDAWPALVDEAARRARRKGCDTLTVDTLTTWAPWAFRGPEAMSFALRTLKAACGREGLAGVVILHNRKQQSDLGAVVDMLGTIAGSAAYDVIAGFSREKTTGECTLTVDGRLGEWSCTARLEDGRYVPLPVAGSGAAPGSEPARAPTGTAVAAHLRPTLERLIGAPAERAELTTDELLALEGGSKRALLDRLAELEKLLLVIREGRGVKGDPHVWKATGAPAVAKGSAPAVRDDPEYVAYLKSPEWAARRAEALRRADGHCGRCGPGGAPPVEVHHLTYERLRAELPGDLIALCAPCHRRAHPAA